MKKLILAISICSMSFTCVFAYKNYDYYPEDRLCAMVRAQEREAEYGNREYAKQLQREIELFRERFGLQWYNDAYCGDSDSYEDGFRDGYEYGNYYRPPYYAPYPYPPRPYPNRPQRPQPRDLQMQENTQKQKGLQGQEDMQMQIPRH